MLSQFRAIRLESSDLKQRQSHLVKTTLEWWDAKIKTFLEVKDSPGSPLSRSPLVCTERGKGQWVAIVL